MFDKIKLTLLLTNLAMGLTLICPQVLISSQCSNEVYVFFQSGIANLPPGKAPAPCDSSNIKSDSVLHVIDEHDINMPEAWEFEQVILT